MRYACDILIKYSEKKFLDFVKKAINVIGFKPNYYDVFFDDFDSNEKLNIQYEENSIEKTLMNYQDIRLIKIKSDIYDNTSNFDWFSITLNKNTDESIGDTFFLEWSNTNNLEFLRTNSFFMSIINDENLVFCYCYNQTDVAEQSNTHYNKFADNPKNIKTIKNKYGDKIIDISNNWGRMEVVNSLEIVAAPNMWFGLGFNPVYSLKEFKKFKYVKHHNNKNVVFIKLFDLYDNPIKHRAKQKYFWNFIYSNKILNKYEIENQTNFAEWLLRKSNN